MQWTLNRVRLGCVLGLAATLLLGCGGGSGGGGGSFIPFASNAGANEPVPGTAIPVPGSEAPPPPPATTENTGEASGSVQVSKITRFSGIAPATAEGATYQSSPAIAYDLGNLVAHGGDYDNIFITPIKGWARYPLARTTLDAGKGVDRFPVIVFLHGRHDSGVPNYQGYDYLAQDLAAQGYVSISIDANAIEDGAWGDRTSQSRAQLVLGTLDRLKAIDARGGPGVLDQLQGKLDFSRIGIMGHSRGGQGISNTLKYNLTRVGVTEEALRAALETSPGNFVGNYPDLAAAVTTSGAIDSAKFASATQKYNVFYASGAESVSPYNFKGALMLAPTDFSGNLGLTNVPLAVVLASCDGDMSDLEGARTFDHNRFSFGTDTATRHQVLVRGANHNFYNTIWTNDDYDSSAESDYCAHRKDGIRLNAEDQRRGGLFLMNSFMRYYVGGEQKFAAYWNAHAQLPDAACPAGKGPCDARVVLTTQKDASKSMLVHRFDQSDGLIRNALGGLLALSGFDEIARCSMPFGGSSTVGDCTPSRLAGFEYQGWAGRGLLSIAEHLELAWSKPEAAVTMELKGASADVYDSLTFRIAVVRPMGQEVKVTLTDTAGKSASVNASDFSDALYLAPTQKAEGLPLVDAPGDAAFANGEVAQLLNMVAVPLAAFPDINMSALAQLKLEFPKGSGKAAITDIEFQNLQRK